MDFSKIKDRLKKENLHKILDFVRKNVRYFSAGVLFVVLVTVLVSCVEPRSGKDNGVGETQSVTEFESETADGSLTDANEDVTALINQYYTAYAAGDIAGLTAVTTPVSDSEQSYVSMISQYVEVYQNVKCYTKPGLDAKSYLVWAYMEAKISGVDTTAPGLDFFYVRTNEEGNLYIDNLYSNYNRSYQENGIDVSVQNLIQEAVQGEDIIALQKEVQEKFDAAVTADESLATVVSTTIPKAITEWMAAASQQQNAEDTENPQEGTEVAEAENTDGQMPEDGDTADGENASETQEEQPVSETVYVVENINVRAAADASSEKLGRLEAGASVTRTGTEGDWSIIDFNGTTAYVKSEFLTTNGGSTASEQGDPNGIAEGTVITIKETTNIRSAMNEDSERIGVAYMGEKVTVVMSYAEGWTKVTWNGQTGYIKTSLLQ